MKIVLEKIRNKKGELVDIQPLTFGVVKRIIPDDAGNTWGQFNPANSLAPIARFKENEILVINTKKFKKSKKK